MENVLKIKGARQHNLKNVDLVIPKNKLIVFTGVSGSGKSSMAFDTIYAEGQRRYVESLSTYARQFLGIMEKPDVDLIEGLSPSISIDQRTTSRNPRSTVGTTTEIYDYFRLLYARIGHPHCPVCGREITRQTPEQIVKKALIDLKNDTENRLLRIMILSPLVMDKKGEFSGLFDNLKSKGYNLVRIDGQIRKFSEDLYIIKTNKHTIEVVVDKLTIDKNDIKKEIYEETLRKRLTDSIEQALKLSEGLVIVTRVKDKGFDFPEYPKSMEDLLFSENFACPYDNIQIQEIEPRSFSFNSPQGACVSCSGLGKILSVDVARMIAPDLSIKEGGIIPFSNMFENDTWFSRLILKVCMENDINPSKAIKDLKEKDIDILIKGTGDREYKVYGNNRFGKETFIYESFKGFKEELENRYKNTESDWVRNEIVKYMKEHICPDCNGFRLKPEILSVTILDKSISALTRLNIKDISKFLKDVISIENLTSREQEIASLIIKEIAERLRFLVDVGLEYLTLDRSSGTLSGGEAQRIRLASQIGSGLTGVLYVLDEPTIGLHQKDNQKLIDTLKRLRDLGNTVIVVEHDRDMMLQSDHLVDFGPGAGILGGEVVSQGKLEDVLKDPNSITAKYLTNQKRIVYKNIQSKLIENNEMLHITGCSQFNLKNVDISIPLGKLVTITGVSGSGKSTLLVDTIYPAIRNEMDKRISLDTGVYKSIDGVDNIDKVILIDQSPIGRTPRSNPATYTKVFDLIREVFTQTKEARALGFKKSRFSFNLKGGRCEVCEGQGQVKIEMQFMSDLWIKCDSCNGKRYNTQTLEVTYKNKNIADILDMTISESKIFFENHHRILTFLNTLEEVGLGYMKLGQPATQLSGGEAQRVKLSSELARRDTGHTFYILDEPTTGLHFKDLEKLLVVLKRLVEKGNTVVVIEHNLDIIKNADWIIDLGPDGGEGGGTLVAHGTVNDIKNCKKSYTGQFLKSII